MQQGFARNFDSLAGIFDFVGQFFEREKVDSDHRQAVDLAIEELFTNMVKYSPEGRKDILIQLEKRENHLEVRLTDFDVAPFDPTQVPDAAIDAPLEKRRPGGLGLHLIRKLFDSMEYNYVDRQSTITLKKSLEVA